MKFWQVRIATFVWGFAVSYYFTGSIDLSSRMFLTMVVGNSVIMWLILREKKPKV